MDLNLRKKKIQEIFNNQNPRGSNTFEKNLNRIGYRSTFLIPISHLVLDTENSRVASKIIEYEKKYKTKVDPSTIDGQAIITKFFWNSVSIEENTRLVEDIEVNGQYEPGFITDSGVIIDGNRRFMVLLKLSKKYPNKVFYFLSLDPLPINPQSTSEDSNDQIIITHMSQKTQAINIESNSLEAFSIKNKKNLNPDTAVKFSLMCDLYFKEQEILGSKKEIKTLRFGDFKFNPEQVFSVSNEVFAQYARPLKGQWPCFFEFKNLNKVQINIINYPEPNFTLDGAFFDFTNITEHYFQNQSYNAPSPLLAITLLDNSNSIVAIKANEKLMARALLENSEEYISSHLEDYLNKHNFYLSAVLGLGIIPLKGSTSQIYIFTKNKHHKIFVDDLVGRFISLFEDSTSKPLAGLSNFLGSKKKKNKNENVWNIDEFYSFSNMESLRVIDILKSPFNISKKITLNDVAISISKVDSEQFSKKILSYAQKGVDYRNHAAHTQSIGHKLRTGKDLDFTVPIDETKMIDNSLIITPGKYRPSFKHLSVDFIDANVEPLITHLRYFLYNLLVKKRKTSGVASNAYEIILDKSIRSEYFSIYIKSAIGKLSSSSAHRWQTPFDYNNEVVKSMGVLPNSRVNIRKPCFSKKSLGQMTIIIPSIEIQDQVIDAHKKITGLASSIEEYNQTLYIDPSLIISNTIENINEMLNLVGKLTDVERVKLMIKKVESDTNEFKQSWRLPISLEEGQKFNKEMSNKLQYGVMKVISSYLNAKGGELLIGYSEVSSQIEGLQNEFDHFWPLEALDKQKDNFMHKFNETLKDTFDGYFLSQKLIRPRFVNSEYGIVLFVVCKKSDRPCFIKGNKAKNILGSSFYRRQGDSSDPLDGEDMYDYISERFPDYKK